MKNNFGLGRKFYWSLPREIRRKIKNEFDAGMTIYSYLKVSTGSEFRSKARKLGFKNYNDFIMNQFHRKEK